MLWIVQGRGATQVKISPGLNWAIQFLTVAYDGVYFPNVSVRMVWISFCALSCKKKRFDDSSRLHVVEIALHLTCVLSTSVTRKDLQFGTWTDPSFQRNYRFRPTTSGSRSGKGLISTPSYVHCLPCSFGKNLFQICAKPKYTAHTDQLYFGYESVNHDNQMQNVLHMKTVFIVSSSNDQEP